MSREAPSRQDHGNVRKRCQHARWSDCACAWYYDYANKDRPFEDTKGRVQVRRREVLGYYANQKEAEKAFEEIKQRIDAGLPPRPEPTVLEAPTAGITVVAYAKEKWLPLISVLRKPSTVGFYTDHLNNHIIPALGDQVLPLTRAQCKRFALSLLDKKLSRATMTGIVITLSAMMSAAVEDDDCPQVTENPAMRLGKLLRDPNAKKSKRLSKDKYFEADEVITMLATAKEHFPEWHAFLMCGFRTGMRTGELRALQWDDVDFEKGFILVHRNFVRGQHTTTKSGEERTVDMTDQLIETLKAWGSSQSEAWLARGLKRPALVFPSNVGTPHDDSKLRRTLKAIVKKAKLRHRSMHAMRHTFISLLLQRRVPLAYVSKQAGHKSLDITLNVYGHFIPGGGREDINRLDDVPAAPRKAKRG